MYRVLYALATLQKKERNSRFSPLVPRAEAVLLLYCEAQIGLTA